MHRMIYIVLYQKFIRIMSTISTIYSVSNLFHAVSSDFGGSLDFNTVP